MKKNELPVFAVSEPHADVFATDSAADVPGGAGPAGEEDKTPGTGRRFTEEQRAAIETTGGRLLVSASAGSGKTAVLTRRVVEKVLAGGRITRLLIVTFTRAAAAEMRARIHDRLARELERDPDNRHLQRQAVLTGRAKICTIDSFCIDLVRRNFQKLDISPDFRLISGAESELMRRNVMNRVFDELYESGDEDFLCCVDAFSGMKDDEGFYETALTLTVKTESDPFVRRRFERFIEMYDPAGPNNDLHQSVWFKVLAEDTIAALEECRQIFESIETIVAEQPDSFAEKYIAQRAEDREILAALIAAARDKGDFNLPARPFGNLSRARPKEPSYDPAIYDRIKALRDAARERYKNLRTQAPFCSQEEYLDELNRYYPVMRGIGRVMERFRALDARQKRQKNVLAFSDTTHMALRLLVETYDEQTGVLTPTPLARELAGDYDEIMLDEYQDTNLLQTLVFEAVSRGGRNLFCVGDLKQSIYRFRNAQPALFAAQQAEFSRTAGQFPQVRFLTKNFRSSRGVLGFVNFFFGHIMRRRIGGADYDQTQWAYAGAAFPGNETDYETEVLFLDRENEKYEPRESGEDGALPGEADGQEAADVTNDYLQGKLCAQRIAQLIDAGRQVYDAESKSLRPAIYSDFAVLMRAAKGHADAVVRAFHEEGIPAFSTQDRDYFESYEVRFMLAFLRAVDNPYTDIPLTAALRSPLFGFSAQELCDLRESHPEDSLYDCLKRFDSPKARDAAQVFARYRSAAANLPVYRLVWDIYNEFSLFSVVGAFRGAAQRQENLRQIYRHARDYESSALKGLYGFLCYMERVEQQVRQRESNVPAPAQAHVTISTIHSAKGLEYPFVFVINMEKAFHGTPRDQLLVHEQLGLGGKIRDRERQIIYPTLACTAIESALHRDELSETMRVFYVAMTRAREKLFLVSSVNSPRGRRGGRAGEGRSAFCQSLAAAALRAASGKAMSERSIAAAASPRDWLVDVLLRHPDGQALLSHYGLSQVRYGPGADADFLRRCMQTDPGDSDAPALRFSVRVIDSDALVHTAQKPFYTREIQPADMDGLRPALDYVYPDIALSKVPAKVSVSDLKGLREMDEDTGFILSRDRNYARPGFLDPEGLTAMEKGTALHKFMQFIDFFDADIAAQRDRLVAAGTLSRAEGAALDTQMLERFTSSPLCARIRATDAVFREYRFLSHITAAQYEPALTGGQGARAVMLQGVIDLFFEDGEGITLVDYKTDRAGDEQYYRDRYTLQLTLYAQALEKITGKPVANRLIYAFSMGQTIVL